MRPLIAGLRGSSQDFPPRHVEFSGGDWNKRPYALVGREAARNQDLAYGQPCASSLAMLPR